MSRPILPWRRFPALVVVLGLAACANPSSHAVASNPPPVAPGPNAVWYHVYFASDSFAITPDGQKVTADLSAYLQKHPGSVATIIGKTDTAGSRDYNMHLSHKRADAVRDTLVYDGNIPADRVETRWTGETRQDVATGKDVAEASNRVVDIAIH